MGCTNSKVSTEEGVARCKQRKRLMKQAVESRDSLAASHALYMIALKGVGAAFRQFAEGETKGDSHSMMYSTTETPNTPRTPPVKGTSNGGAHLPLSPQTRLSALRFHPRSLITRSVSSPDSVTLDFLPPPPPPPTFTVNRMEHTPPVIPTRIYRLEDSSTGNSYMKTFRIEDDAPPPLIQPVQYDDAWRYGRSSSTHRQPVRGHNAAPPPPPPVRRSSWGDLFLDPFRPAPVSYSYMGDDRRSLDMEVRRSDDEQRRRKVEEEQRRRKEVELREADMATKRRQQELQRFHEEQDLRAREMEQKRVHEIHHRPPPVKIVDVRSLPVHHHYGMPNLEDEIPELEDVDDDTDIDGPPPKDFVSHVVKQPVPAPPPPAPPEIKPEPQAPPKPETPPKAPTPPKAETPPKAPPTPPKAETPPKAPPTPPKAPPTPPKAETPPKAPPTPPKAETPPKAPSPKVVKPPSPKVVEPPPPPPPPPPEIVVEAPPPPTPSPKVTPKARTPPGRPPKPEPTFAKTNSNLAMVFPERSGRDLLDVLKEVDDCFLNAAKCGEVVSRMLETKKAPNYPSSFSDGWKGVGESARMNLRRLSMKAGSTSFRTSSNMSSISSMSVLTDDSPNIMSMRRSVSNLSSQRISSQRFSEEIHSHTHSLVRLLAWEKKLYLEVKQAENLRVELERKLIVLKGQDAKNDERSSIDKTRAAIDALQTRMAVAIQAVDNCYSQVQKLRDDELYPQLLELLDGMGTMWREMSACHEAQLRAVQAIGRLDETVASSPTTSSHRQATSQLELALNKWSEATSRNVHSQKEYLRNLTSWLRLSLMQFGDEEMPQDNRRSGSRSPSQSPRSPFYSVGPSRIYELCQQWQDELNKVSERPVVEAIGAFTAVVRQMLGLQVEELRIKKRVENLQRELERREQSLQIAVQREPVSRSPTTGTGSDNDRRFDMVVANGDGAGAFGAEVAEKRAKYEATRQKLEQEHANVKKAYIDTRTFTLNKLQVELPRLFQAVISFVNMEGDVYDKLNKV
jgi:hypothetical protein